MFSDTYQEESRSTSQNVKMGFQYRFQKGEMQINHNRLEEKGSYCSSFGSGNSY